MSVIHFRHRGADNSDAGQTRRELTSPQTLNTSTTDWFQPAYSPTTSSTRVLAISQQPYPKHNSWKYSYKPLHKVYPPYDTNRMPLVDNVFNRYGAAFTTGAGS
nr:hypothetical protein BaRGS_034246 [Batillaria attramentaria]